MFRFSLIQLLMATGLVGIGLMFVRSDGCGRRKEIVPDVEFSSDGRELAVATVTARDSMTPGKIYVRDVCRTISTLDAADGGILCIVEQNLQPGNCGPAFRFFGHAGNAVEYVEGNRSLAILDYGGGTVRLFDRTLRQFIEQPKFANAPAFDFCLSSDGMRLATSNDSVVEVWSMATGERLKTVASPNFSFRRAPYVAFSPSSAELVVYANPHSKRQAVELFQIDNDEVFGLGAAGTFATDDAAFASGVEFASSGQHIVVANDERLTVVEKDGDDGYLFHHLNSVQPVHGIACSRDGTWLAAACGNEIVVVELDTCRVTSRMKCDGRATSIALSPDGKYLAFGDIDGRLTMCDATTGDVHWSVKPPGRRRPAWTLAIGFLALWVLVEGLIIRRAKRRTDARQLPKSLPLEAFNATS